MLKSVNHKPRMYLHAKERSHRIYETNRSMLCKTDIMFYKAYRKHVWVEYIIPFQIYISVQNRDLSVPGPELWWMLLSPSLNMPNPEVRTNQAQTITTLTTTMPWPPASTSSPALLLQVLHSLTSALISMKWMIFQDPMFREVHLLHKAGRLASC